MNKPTAIGLVWVLIFACVAVWYVVLFRGAENPQAPPAAASQVRLALDSFSGYCIFRSEEFKKRLADKKIAFASVDDGANYTTRMESIRKGTTPYAVFTVDALINQTPRDGEPPATIVMLIDETRGADAMIAYKRGVPTIDALNSPEARVVLVGDSPSETLLRVVRSRFALNQLPVERTKCLITVPQAEDVYQMFLKGRPSDPRAYVLWEPYVSLALKEQGAHRLIDSADCKGMIADVLVVQTDYLQKNKEQVLAVVEAYLETLHQNQQTADGMTRQVQLDAEIIKEPRVKDHAESVVRGIWWKNTMENYAHFGLLPPVQATGVVGAEDMIRNIINVLQQTRGPDDPSPEIARPEKLVNNEILRMLHERKPRPLHSDQKIREDGGVAGTISFDWKLLVRVEKFNAPVIRFGSSGKLSPTAEDELTELADNLKTRWPRYHLQIMGDAEGVGDEIANRARARERAEKVLHYLVEQQVPRERLQTNVEYLRRGKIVTFIALESR